MTSRPTEEWVDDPKNARTGPTTTQSHLNGVPWFEAPTPRRWHRCRAQTIGWLGFEQVERCACGAIRGGGYRTWLERNSSRKSPRPSVEGSYVERAQAEMARFDSVLAKWNSTATDPNPASEGDA